MSCFNLVEKDIYCDVRNIDPRQIFAKKTTYKHCKNLSILLSHNRFSLISLISSLVELDLDSIIIMKDQAHCQDTFLENDNWNLIVFLKKLMSKDMWLEGQ